MTSRYPEIEPYAHGMLNVGDGHLIYWETCGNPDGKPVVVLHGGPGSGCTAGIRRFFNPARYRIILFDQRNCGRSTPHASDFDTDLATNTTHHLIADMEALREHLGVERWMLYGGSWGSTLALAYAETYPHCVAEIILVGVTMTRKSEIDWLYRGVAPIYPEQYVRFREGVPETERDGDLVEAYYRLLNHPDHAVRMKAAKDWDDWESASASLHPNPKPNTRWIAQREAVIARSRIVTHYFYHRAWLEDNTLLHNAHKLSGIPGVLVQGRLDLEAPFVTAWELSQAWPDAELVTVWDAGHSMMETAMAQAVIAATDRFVSPT